MNESECNVDHDGTKEWFLNGKLHRVGGPAYEGANGTKAWLLNGKLHREGGPAYEGADRSKEWWLRGVHYESPNKMPLSLFLAYVKWMRDNEKN